MKHVSVVMSFIAVLAAGIVLSLAIYRDKGKTVAVANKSLEVAKPTFNAQPPIATNIQSGHLINEQKLEVKPLPIPIAPMPNDSVPLPSVPFVKSVEPPQPQPIAPPRLVLPPQPPEILYTSDSSIKFAVGDLLTIPQEEKQYMRYFSLHNIPKAKRREYAATFSFVCNSLSTRKKINIPQFVGASDETVIRVDIRHYNWKPEALEKLGLKGSGPKPFPEPYFHYVTDTPITEKVKVKKKVTEKILWKNEQGQQYVGSDGKPLYKDIEKEVEVEEITSTKRDFCPTVAPWLDPIANKALYDGTCSSFPMFRVDWFISNAILAPGYYDLLGIGAKDKDFEKLIFADDELARKAKSQDKAIVVASIVARNNRTLTRSPTFTGGYYWVSHDSLTSVNDRDYVKKVLDEKFDATEDIASLPNGLQVYFLTDGKGNRIDFANPDIAIDSTAADKLVRTGRSCMVCHADGIRPINDEIRTLTKKLQDPKQVRLLITREGDAEKVEDLFSNDLDEQLIKDQNYYRAAVAKASGLQSEVIAKTLNEIYNWYVERLMTADDVCREVGINVNNLDTYIKASKDNVILGLLKSPTRPIRRDQWEAAYGRFEITIGARRQGLEHADPYPPGPLIELPIK